jgi:uncharacterized repeat protein (TIGR01451 family)
MRLIRIVAAALLLTASLAAPTLAGGLVADLTVTKTDSPDPVAAGSNVTYTITVVNATGGLTAANVEVEDILPMGTTFVSATEPGGWTLTSPPPGGTGTVTWTIASLNPLPPPTEFTLTVQVDPNYKPGILTNTATASTTTNEIDLTDNSATTTTEVTMAASPAASLADAAMAQPTTGSPLAVLGFAVLLAGALSASAVLSARRSSPRP